MSTTRFASTRLQAPRRTAFRLVATVSGIIVTGVALAGIATAPASAASTRTVASGYHQNGSTEIATSGKWTTQQSANALGGSFADLNSSGKATISFTGTGVAWVARQAPYAGQATVTLDGKRVKTVDLYAKTTEFQKVVYRTTGLAANKKHTLVITRTGGKNAASTGRSVFVDAINVLDRVAPTAPKGLTAKNGRTGIQLSWSANREADVVAYRVYRLNDGKAELLGTATAEARSFLDVGLKSGKGYSYRVAAVDSSDNVSPMSSTVSFEANIASATSDADYSNCPATTVKVTNRAGLLDAVAKAEPGTVIEVAAGHYGGQIPVTVHGTSNAPIWICGSRNAIFDRGGVTLNGGIRVTDSSHLVLSGFTVRNSQKGVMVMNSDHVVVAGLRVEKIGEEGIHLERNTTDSLVIDNSINETGLMTAEYGEGVYVGMAKANWCLYNDCQPDHSDRNTVTGNDISGTAAESIDVKEASRDGVISNNTMNGDALTSRADSLIVVRANGWIIEGNKGTDSPADGIQIDEISKGFGLDNIAIDNHFDGSMPGYGVRLANPNALNYVGCDNVIAGNGTAIANIDCQL